MSLTENALNGAQPAPLHALEEAPAPLETTARRRPTVVFLDHTAMMSGGEIALLHLVRHLDKTRYEPVVVLSAPGPLEEELRHSGIETHVLALAPSVTEARKDDLNRGTLTRVRDMLRVAAYSVRLASFLRRRRADLVHTNSLKADIFGGVAGRLARVPVLWHVRDRIEDDYLPPKVVRVFRWMANVLPKYVIANSQATFATLKLSEKRGRAVHDGIPIPEAHAATPGSPQAPVIGIVGRITPWKGQHIFLDAAARVREEFPEARFQIIGSSLFGESNYEKEIHDQCKQLRLEESIQWLGFRTDVPDLIRALDVLVHASTVGEPFGQVVVEGMVEGKPVIATRGGGVPEIIEDGVSGILVPMSDASAMSEAILQVLHNPQHAASLGKAARERVQAHFSIEHTARNVENVYEAMLCGKM